MISAYFIAFEITYYLLLLSMILFSLLRLLSLAVFVSCDDPDEICCDYFNIYNGYRDFNILFDEEERVCYF
jgi:hypothetical protein